MADCKNCLCGKVCKYNDGVNLYCKEGYDCPLIVNKDDYIKKESITSLQKTKAREVSKGELLKVWQMLSGSK